jgi:predicted PurR-regulated permease PerM
VLSGVGFAIFGVPSPIIWAFVASIASFIPSFGTGLVMIPAVIFLFASGSIPSAIGLAIWGLVVVGLVDNLVGPILINRSGFRIHPLFILISVLGGIEFFGIVGFIAGPVIIGLLFALLEIYPFLVKDKANSQ